MPPEAKEKATDNFVDFGGPELGILRYGLGWAVA